jgi:hypothetical protein
MGRRHWPRKSQPRLPVQAAPNVHSSAVGHLVRISQRLWILRDWKLWIGELQGLDRDPQQGQEGTSC